MLIILFFEVKKNMKNKVVGMEENFLDLLQLVYWAKRGHGDFAITQLNLPSKDLEGLKFPATLICWQPLAFNMI